MIKQRVLVPFVQRKSNERGRRHGSDRDLCPESRSVNNIQLPFRELNEVVSCPEK